LFSLLRTFFCRKKAPIKGDLKDLSEQGHKDDLLNTPKKIMSEPELIDCDCSIKSEKEILVIDGIPYQSKISPDNHKEDYMMLFGVSHIKYTYSKN